MASLLRALPLLATVVSAAPFMFPLSNGFPNPSPAALTAIEEQAHGTLSNQPPPPKLASSTCTAFQLIAFNEIHEVAFFTELLTNITTNVSGYDIRDPEAKHFAINAVTAIIAQEELHALNAETVVTKVCGLQMIQPCEYAYPVSDLNSAIELASTFTDVVLGTLQDAQNVAGTNGDIGVLGPIGSVIGQEGEQNGYFRSLLGKIPSALPFLTRSAAQFAFSAINQDFVVPGTCPNVNTINIPIFGVLTLDSWGAPVVQPATQTLKFTLTASSSTPPATDYANWSLVYINQQNVPVVEKIINPTVNGNTLTFEALFPFDQFEMNGLTIAAVTANAGPFANADAVAAAAAFGPALIEVN